MVVAGEPAIAAAVPLVVGLKLNLDLNIQLRREQQVKGEMTRMKISIGVGMGAVGEGAADTSGGPFNFLMLWDQWEQRLTPSRRRRCDDMKHHRQWERWRRRGGWCISVPAEGPLVAVDALVG